MNFCYTEKWGIIDYIDEKKLRGLYRYSDVKIDENVSGKQFILAI